MKAPRRLSAVLVALIGCAGGHGCSSDPGARGTSSSKARRSLQPPPVQQQIVVKGLPVDGAVSRERASQLPTRLIALPSDETDTERSQLLGDGTLYRLELDRLGNRGAVLVRFDDVAGDAPSMTRIPLVAPPGVEIRRDEMVRGGLRVATSSLGLLMNRGRRGTVWWEEDGPRGRLIEFRIDGDRATMLPPGPPLGDPNARPVARRFNRTPDRELAYRLTTGTLEIGPQAPYAFLGGHGFGLAVARIGSPEPEAFVEAPAFDLPHVDVAEPASGRLTVTIGYITGTSGHAVQVTYDFEARTWRDHRPLIAFPEAQSVEVADVGEAGVLVVLRLPWNGAGHDPETGLYWVRREQPVRHLLQRIRELRTVTLADGFVAVFEDEFRRDRSPSDPQDVFVLRAQGERLALYRFLGPGPCSTDHFVSLGGNRFLATDCGADQAVTFELPGVVARAESVTPR